MTPHCGTCAGRPRANLTARNGQLWCPECLYEATAFEMAHQHAREPAQGMAFGEGLVVVDIPRARRLRRVK